MIALTSIEQIYNTVKGFISTGVLFTAWDVTQATRKASQDFKEGHTVVRDVVSTLLNTEGGYSSSRIGISTKGAVSNVTLYHPSTVDPLTYPLAVANTVDPATHPSDPALNGGILVGGNGGAIVGGDPGQALANDLGIQDYPDALKG